MAIRIRSIDQQMSGAELIRPKFKYAMWVRSKAIIAAGGGDCIDLEQRRCSIMVDQLLLEIYANVQVTAADDYNSATSSKSSRSNRLLAQHLEAKHIVELKQLRDGVEHAIQRIGGALVHRLKRRDALRRQNAARCDVITFLLRGKREVSESSTEMRFSLTPLPGDSGFAQWHSAMKMVAQLPEGIPPEFRRQMWLTLADKHLESKGIVWSEVERDCFNEWSHTSDSELGVQIVKDLHRTGCSLFCGKDGKENQALLKRVLLAYARWNKVVGYCQGFNMLAALMLQVTDRSDGDALKLMIYLIEGVLPDSYFADSLRGLSVDMAVFREMLRAKLPVLSRHLDNLQVATREGTTIYEPPLTNVFTMQWFLTLFCNCLPQPTVLRVWDLIMLEGNEILLRTSLAIWQVLADRILAAKTADEFYCVMGILMREILEFELIDTCTLIRGIVAIGPLPQLASLREHHLYNINPWGCTGHRPHGPNNPTKRKGALYHKEKLVLDIGVLKKQYSKLKQRQRQAHIIINAAVARQTTRTAPLAVNQLLHGRRALVPTKRVGPPKGAIPPPRLATQPKDPPPSNTVIWNEGKPNADVSSSSSSSSSSDTELCDDPEVGESDDDASRQLPPPRTLEDNEEPEVSLIELAPSMCYVPEYDPLLLDNTEITKVEPDSEIMDTDMLNSLPTEESAFDFEQFLEERVQSLKEKRFSSEESLEDTSEQDRIKYARKNSVRALEIIQENSLILHRILQCQSRLTPSPPVDGECANEFLEVPQTDNFQTEAENANTKDMDKEESEEIEDFINDDETAYINAFINKYNFITKHHQNTNEDIKDESPKEQVPQFWDEGTVTTSPVPSPTTNTTVAIDDGSESGCSSGRKPQELIEIGKNSKYNSILEYSRNLDEKFNNLILNSPRNVNLTNVQDRIRKSNYSFDVPDTKSMEESPKQSHSYSDFTGLVANTSLITTTPVDQHHHGDDANAKPTIDVDALIESPSLKSPNRIFNPFPVNISSRQNKQVPFGLGLYKK